MHSAGRLRRAVYAFEIRTSNRITLQQDAADELQQCLLFNRYKPVNPAQTPSENNICDGVQLLDRQSSGRASDSLCIRWPDSKIRTRLQFAKIFLPYAALKDPKILNSNCQKTSAGPKQLFCQAGRFATITTGSATSRNSLPTVSIAEVLPQELPACLTSEFDRP